MLVQILKQANDANHTTGGAGKLGSSVGFGAFDDAEQIRLKDFCTKLDILDYNWILSNSDLKGKNENDNFFDDLYSDFTISRVYARRSINANPENFILGVPLSGRAFRSNLFARSSQKGFPLQSLTQRAA